MKSNNENQNNLSKDDDLFKSLIAEESPLKLSAKEIIPKLKFDPGGGFTMPFEIQAKLHLPQPVDTIESENNSELIPKLKFNPNGGFTTSAEILEQLHLPKSADTIDITSTNAYSSDEKSSLIKSFIIREEGIFLGIIINITTKEEVLKIMEEYSSFRFDVKLVTYSLFYDDLAINFLFDDAGIVNEFDFGPNFRGTTSKGLRIGDTIEKAIEIYGKPRMKTSIGAIWDNMKVFSDKFSINGIKIRG